MNKRIKKILQLSGFIVSVYLTVFLAFVLPFHHHADFNEHEDCVVCIISHQPAVSNTNVNLQVLLVLLFAVALANTSTRIFRKTHLHLRSPPVF